MAALVLDGFCVSKALTSVILRPCSPFERCQFERCRSQGFQRAFLTTRSMSVYLLYIYLRLPMYVFFCSFKKNRFFGVTSIFLVPERFLIFLHLSCISAFHSPNINPYPFLLDLLELPGSTALDDHRRSFEDSRCLPFEVKC